MNPVITKWGLKNIETTQDLNFPVSNLWVLIKQMHFINTLFLMVL